MASLYKKPITVTDPKTGEKIKSRSKKWWGRYRDENGTERRVPLAADKAAAQAMLNELVRKVELRIAGLESPFEKHLKRPLAEHLVDFRAFLEGKGNSTKHSRQTCNRVQAIIEGCKFTRLTSVSPSAVVDWLKDERASGRLSIQSSNYYLGCIKSFLSWMVKDGRIDRNPLAHLTAMNAKVDVRRERRCLPPEEFGLFLEAAGQGPRLRKILGKDRRMLYILAASSGFRCSELASLTPESFDLCSDSPCVVVEAAYSKRRRRDTQPLPRELAPVLAAWLKDKPARRVLWPGGWINHAAKMVRADLDAARVAWVRAATTTQERREREASSFLSYHDDRGLVFDFHALRHQYISNLASAGVHPKIAQTLARHSTITLTLDRYTHTGLVDLVASVNNLPSVPVETPKEETGALKATGTENWSSSEVPTVVPRGAENGAILPAPETLPIASNCRDEKRNGTADFAATPEQGTANGIDLHQTAPACTKKNGRKCKGPSRIRTGDGGFAIRCPNSPTLVQPNELGRRDIIKVPTVVPTSLRICSDGHLTPELAKIINAWPSLPEVAKVGILAMIEAAKCDPVPGGHSSR